MNEKRYSVFYGRRTRQAGKYVYAHQQRWEQWLCAFTQKIAMSEAWNIVLNPNRLN
jgi:hypothetical protein